jgi:hypothetical protein
MGKALVRRWWTMENGWPMQARLESSTWQVRTTGPWVVKPQALGPWVLKWLLTSPEAQGSLDVLRAWETQHSLAQALDGTERAPARGIRL